MWKILFFFLRSCRVRLTGASPEWALNEFSERRILFREIRRMDALTIELRIRRKDLPSAMLAAQRAMCDLDIVQPLGFFALFFGLKKRPVLLFFTILTIFIAIFLPKFVWFYEVTGNERIPTQQIIRELDAIGVGFGTYGPTIKPQMVKTRMMLRIPEIEWLTVTQNGACAQVVVREREEKEPILDRKTPQDVIASRAGLLTRVEIFEGNVLCQVGDPVAAGELLVSAYTDLGYKTQVSSASAEIYANTWYKLCTVMPETNLQKIPTMRTKTALSLILGRKRMNIYGNSGISDPECDKMTTYREFSLPGGFYLPVTLEITRLTDYDTREITANSTQARQLLESTANVSVTEQMIAGSVRTARHNMKQEKGLFWLYSTMECEEMIARMVPAQMLKEVETDDRTDH